MTLELYQRTGQAWSIYQPALQKRTYMAYDLQQQRRTNVDPELLPPATPSLDATQTFLIIQLPIFKVLHPVSPQPRETADLLKRLATPPSKWATPLWHRIRPSAPLDALHQAIYNNSNIIISSDAGVDAAKHSCCAWTIYSNTILWEGEGIVPGNRDDTYSGRSEAFGILTAMLFLQQYLNQYPHQQTSQQYTLTVYCDNGGTVTQATKYSRRTTIYPNQTISDDYDVYNEIAQMADDLLAFTIHFVHVKGHQNNSKRKLPLTLQARLNIECDERATKFLPQARKSRQTDNPALPHTYPHVRVHGQIIVREMAQALRRAAQTPEYRIYLKNKFQWADRDCDDINWTAFKFAQRKLTPADSTRLHKFLHDWLPLKGAKHHSSPTESSLCPQCHREDEDIWHFLECTHPEREARFQKLLRDLNALHTQHRIDPNMSQLLCRGLYAIRHDQLNDHQADDYPDNLREIFHAQQGIGWDQLYYGRISTQWAQYITAHSQYKTNGDVFYSKVIGLTWTYVFDCWKQRNLHLHSPDTAPPDFPVLAEQVHRIVQLANTEPALAMAAPTLTAEQILQRPIPMIRSWALRGAQHIQNYLTAAHQRAVIHTHDIRNFFKPKQNPDLRPP